jgi:hypothetical protein
VITTLLPSTGIFVQVVPTGQLVKTNVPSTHCANCPFTQSIVPAVQLPEVASEDGVCVCVDGSADVVLRQLAIVKKGTTR